MRILLDESLPRKLSLELPGHDAQTVQKRGWSGLIETLRPLIPKVLEALRTIQPGQLVQIGA